MRQANTEGKAMNALITSISNQRNKELRQYAAGRRLAKRRRARPAHRAERIAAAVEIRRLDVADDREVERLAGRDSSETPAGELLGAEVDGHLIAAISLSDGSRIADPFTRTDEVVQLLSMRASQLGAA